MTLPVMSASAYNDNAQLQHSAMQPSLDLLTQAAAFVPLTPGTPFQVADLGASQGVNSIAPVKAILGVLSERLAADQTLEVLVHHEDLPSNDFSSLLALITNPDTSYTPSASNNISVFSSCVGKSYYHRLVPSSSLNLSFAFTTLHWLSTRPLRPKDTMFAMHSKDSEVVSAFTDQAHQDLTTFLRLRAKETVPGGALVAHIPLLSPEPNVYPWTLQYLDAVTHEHLADGRLQPEEVQNMSSFSFLRRENEVLEDLKAVEGLWKVEAQFTKQVVMPLYAEFEAGRVTAEELASMYTEQHKAVLRDFMVAMLALTRGADQASKVVDGMFEDYRKKLVAEPHHEFNMFFYVLLTRTSTPC